jgi:hypothetical protein
MPGASLQNGVWPEQAARLPHRQTRFVHVLVESCGQGTSHAPHWSFSPPPVASQTKLQQSWFAAQPA